MPHANAELENFDPGSGSVTERGVQPALGEAGNRRGSGLSLMDQVRAVPTLIAHTRGASVILAAACFLALGFLLSRAVWDSPATQWLGWPGDPEQAIWFLRWTPFAIGQGLNPLLTSYLNYPAGVNLMWNTSIPFMGLALAPISLTAGPIVAYNAMVTLAFPLSAFCAFLALRRYTRSGFAAFVGGALYGFSPYMVSQVVEHAFLVIAFCPPLLLLLYDEAIVRRERQPWRIGVLAGVVAVVQLLISEEMLASEAIGIAVLTVILAAMYPTSVRHARAHVGKVALTAFLTFLILGAWPLLTQFFGPQRVGGRLWDADLYSTDLANFVVPTSAQAFAPANVDTIAARFGPQLFEVNAFVGLPLILLLAGCVWRWRNVAVVRVAALTTAVLTLLSLGPHFKIDGHSTVIPLPYALLARFPLLYDVLPNRLPVYMYLGVGLLVAIFIDRAIRGSRPASKLIWCVALAISLLPLLPAPLVTTPATLPGFFGSDQARVVPVGSVALVAPRTYGPLGVDLMLWQAAAGDRFRMPDGYAYVPHGIGMYVGDDPFNPPPSPILDAMRSVQSTAAVPRLTLSLRRRLAADLLRRHVDTVIVGPMDHADSMVTFFFRLFRRPGIGSDGVVYWPNVLKQGVAP